MKPNSVHKYATLKGELVRSLSEKYIADFFFTHRVQYQYEMTLVLDGHKLIPDFYLPQYNLYVEFWGKLDDPAYFRSFRMKTDLYKAHGIKFIALQDNDLPTLDKNFEIKLKLALKS